MTESATATWVATQTTPGVYRYTITLTDTGTTSINIFWFAWDNEPDQEFMNQPPTDISGPDGSRITITTHVYNAGIGYGIE